MGDGDGGLTVAKVDEKDSFRLFLVEVLSLEETIVEGNSSALIDYSRALKTGDLNSVIEALALHIRRVRRDSENDAIGS